MLWDTSVERRSAGAWSAALAEVTNSGTDIADGALRAFIQAHEVVWETTPRAEWRAGRRVLVGYEISLFARHPRGFAADPGDATCDALRAALEGLARRVLPRPLPAGLACALTGDPARLALRPDGRFEPEVELRLEILHATATFAASDAAQKECLHEVESGLRALGARAGRWRRR